MSGHLGGLPMRSVTSVDIVAQVSGQAASVMRGRRSMRGNDATATEHGDSSASVAAPNISAVTATEHDQTDECIENLCMKLLTFLSDALLETRVPSFRSGSLSLLESYKMKDECDEMVFNTICAWSVRRENHAIFDQPALLQHEKIFDMVMGNKQGETRENTFLPCCRKVYGMRTQALRDGTASEHPEGSEKQPLL